MHVGLLLYKLGEREHSPCYLGTSHLALSRQYTPKALLYIFLCALDTSAKIDIFLAAAISRFGK